MPTIATIPKPIFSAQKSLDTEKLKFDQIGYPKKNELSMGSARPFRRRPRGASTWLKPCSSISEMLAESCAAPHAQFGNCSSKKLRSCLIMPRMSSCR
jgi:hypothetical protein